MKTNHVANKARNEVESKVPFGRRQMIALQWVNSIKCDTIHSTKVDSFIHKETLIKEDLYVSVSYCIVTSSRTTIYGYTCRIDKDGNICDREVSWYDN